MSSIIIDSIRTYAVSTPTRLAVGCCETGRRWTWAELDRAVDRLYRPQGFASDRERVEHLFGLYERMVAPLLAAPAKRKRTPRSA